jgi:hypothetical protein
VTNWSKAGRCQFVSFQRAVLKWACVNMMSATGRMVHPDM